MIKVFLIFQVLLCLSANSQNYYADSVFQILSEYPLHYKDVDESIIEKLKKKYPFDIAKWQPDNPYVISLEYQEFPCEIMNVEYHKEWRIGRGRITIPDTIYSESLCPHLTIVNRTEGKEDILFVSTSAFLNGFIHESKRHKRGVRSYDTLNYVSDLKLEFSTNMESSLAPSVYYERYWNDVGLITGVDRYYTPSGSVSGKNLRNTYLFSGLRLYFNSLDLRILKGFYLEYGIFGCLIGIPKKAGISPVNFSIEREFGFGWRGGAGFNFHLDKRVSLNLGIQYRRMFGKNSYDLIGNVSSRGLNLGPVFNLSIGYRFNHR